MAELAKVLLVSALALTFTACNGRTESNNQATAGPSPAATRQLGGAPLSAKDTASIKDVGLAHTQAMKTGDAAAAGRLYTEDCVRYPPDSPEIRGRDNVVKNWQSLGFETKDYTYESDGLVGSGDIAYERGRWTWTHTVKGKPNLPPMTVNGNCVSIFQRQPDDTWKIVAESWSLHQLPDAATMSTEGHK